MAKRPRRIPHYESQGQGPPCSDIRPPERMIIKVSRAARSLFHRHKRILRSWLIFLGALGTMHVLLDWSGPRVWDLLDVWTARTTAWSLFLLGADGHADGKFVTSSIFSIQIIRECTAVHPIMIYAAAVVAYPCRWRPKVLGIVVGALTILLINQFRLVSLCYIGYWYPDMFETAHMLVWQSLIIFVTVLLWVMWASFAVRVHDPGPA